MWNVHSLGIFIGPTWMLTLRLNLSGTRNGTLWYQKYAAHIRISRPGKLTAHKINMFPKKKGDEKKGEQEALNLDIDSRANFANKLLLSLDEPTLLTEVEQLWLDEAERRLDDYRAGKVHGIPGNKVFKRAIAGLP
jgi:putative addiction module component (TIGR02574 family)